MITTIRRQLYRAASRLGDLHAIETGRIPQRMVRKFVYRHANRLLRKLF